MSSCKKPESAAASSQQTRNKAIERFRCLGYVFSVKIAKKRRARSDTDLLDHATNKLLAALKKDMENKEGHVDYERLRKEGYSERLLDRLEKS